MYTTVFVSASCRVFIHRNPKKHQAPAPASIYIGIVGWPCGGYPRLFTAKHQKKSCLYIYVYYYIIICIYIYISNCAFHEKSPYFSW